MPWTSVVTGKHTFGTVIFMVNVVCPGSFDPVTNGHLDIFARAAALFDRVTVAVLVNENKKGLFTTEERIAMLAEATKDLDNISIDTFDGLLVDYCRHNDIGAIVKGLRAATDFDYELQMAHMNRSLTEIDTVFLPTAAEHSFLSSTLVKEVARLGGDVAQHVPEVVLTALNQRFAG